MAPLWTRFESLDEELVGSSLEIDQEAQFLFRGFPSAGPDGLATRDVHGDGFGDIDVLAGGDTRGGMLGMKIRRRFDDHGVQFLLQQTLVAGQSVVLPFRWDADFLAGSLGAIPEVVGRRHEVVAAVLLEQACDPGASAPAANDADIDLGVGGIAKGKVRANHGESRGGARAHHEAPTSHLACGPRGFRTVREFRHEWVSLEKGQVRHRLSMAVPEGFFVL